MDHSVGSFLQNQATIFFFFRKKIAAVKNLFPMGNKKQPSLSLGEAWPLDMVDRRGGSVVLAEESFLAVNCLEDFRAALDRRLQEMLAGAKLAQDASLFEFLFVLAEGLVDDLVVFDFDDEHTKF